MTYCAERTNLLARAGRAVAEKLLPAPFALWFSDHDTGRQMTIVVSVEKGDALPVWKGSVWHSGRYEFNDTKDTPGLQPDFAFAQPVIDKYFADVQAVVSAQDAEWKALNEQRQERDRAAKEAAIAKVRKVVGASQ